jgi:hypothetical protein
MTDPLRRSLIRPERDNHDDIVVEARTITSAGHVTAYGARVQTPMQRYLRRGQVLGRHAVAADRLYRAWAISQGAKIPAPGCVAYSPGGWTDAQIQATRSYVEARVYVGARLWPLLFHVVCLDYPVDRVCNEFLKGANPTATMALLRHALDELADCFGLPD